MTRRPTENPHSMAKAGAFAPGQKAGQLVAYDRAWLALHLGGQRKPCIRIVLETVARVGVLPVRRPAVIEAPANVALALLR